MVKKITISFLFMFFIFVLFSQNRKLRKDYDLIKNNQFEEAYTNLSDIRNKEMYTPFSYFLFSEYFGNINNKKYNVDSCFWYLKKSYTLSKSYVDKKELEDACEDIKFCILKLNNKLDSIADFAYQKKYSTTNNLNDLNYFISFYTETKSNIKAKERLDMLLYNNAKSKKSIQSLEKFIQDYPQSQFLDSSKLEIEKLEYNDVIIKNDVVSFDQFLKKYPNSTFKTEINKKKQKKIFDTYLLMNKENEFNIYIEKYPESDFIAEAKKKRDLLVYEESLLKNTIDGYSSVLTKYPEIEFAQQIRFNIKKLETIITEGASINNEDLKSENGVSLVVTGHGQTILEAKQNAIRSAIEQAYGAFITSKMEIFNDKIVSDEMSSISSGNIKSFEIITESKQIDSTYAVILKVIVSVDKLTSFVQSKGYAVEVKGGLFALNIEQQILNESSEIKTINSMVNLLHESMQKAFSYTIKSSNPKSLDANNNEWEIPIEVIVKANKNMELCSIHLIKTLKSISLNKNEINDYIKLNKKYFQIILNINNINDTFYLRKKESVELLSLFTDKWEFYIKNFLVKSDIEVIDLTKKYKCSPIYIDLINKDYYYLRYLESSKKEYYENNIDCFCEIYIFQPFEIFTDETGYERTRKSYRDDFDLEDHFIFKNKTINFPGDQQIVAKLSLRDVKTLNEIKGITSYNVENKGVVSKFSHGGYVVYEENGHGLVVSTKEIGNLPWEEAKKTCDNLVLNGYSDWYLPSKEELNVIYRHFQGLRYLSFFQKRYYSSTSECLEIDGHNSCEYKWYQDFENGEQKYDGYGSNTSDNPQYVIAVRKF